MYLKVKTMIDVRRVSLLRREAKQFNSALDVLLIINQTLSLFIDVALKTEAGLNSVVLGVEVIVTDAGRCCSLCNLLYYLFSPLLSYSRIGYDCSRSTIERGSCSLQSSELGLGSKTVHCA